jgi:hypothetical protein
VIDVSNPAEVRREAERRAALRARGITTYHESLADTNPATISVMAKTVGTTYIPPRIIDPIEYKLTEKQIEHACDQLAQKAGARVIRFSHPGKTQQTPGIADRLYCFPRAEIALWFEVKTPRGEQRPGQVLFEEIVTASGQHYACGGIGDLRAWLIENLAFRAEEL